MALILRGNGVVEGLTDLPDNSISSEHLATGAISSEHLAVGAITSGLLPAGSVLQAVQTIKTDTFSTQSITPVDITGFSVNITPSSTSSKILVQCSTYISNSAYNGYVFLLRDSSQIFTADAAGSRPATSGCVGGYSSGNMTYSLNSSSITYLDSPNTTSQVTYKLQMSSYSASHITYMNRTYTDRDTAGYEPRAASSITVMEIAG